MTMASTDVQEGGIQFGERWKLFPIDDRNWELCHLHANADNAKSRKAGTAGQMRWNRCGRFYSYNTVVEALRYAADVELKAKCAEEAVAIAEAAEMLRQTFEGFGEALKAWGTPSGTTKAAGDRG